MSLIKKISYLALSLVVFSMASTALAQATETVSKLEPIDCFAPGLYKFQSVQVSVGPEKQNYTAGETINFAGNIINQNNYPVVDGNVFVRISKDNPNYITDGHYAVDEIMPLVNISIDASSSLPVNFSWKVPKDLGMGDYRADYFFSVGKKFNLGGLPFTNEIIVGFSGFKIANTKNTEFVLDRVNTKVNGEKYNHIGNWPSIEKGNKIEITQPVKNLSNKEIKVTVNYDLYFWDSLDVSDKIDSKTEVVTVPANSSKNLTYVIPKSNQSVYYLKINATSGDASSIVNIRTSSDIEKARINYPAITAFPLMKGETANLFSCFHTVYGAATNTKLILTLTDKEGNTVVKGEYSGIFTSDMAAAFTKFTADEDYRFLNLKAELFDGGKITDSYETQYDCSTLRSEKCEVAAINNINENFVLYTLILILIALLGLLIIPKYAKNSVARKIFIGIFILLLISSVVLLVGILILGTDKANAENVSADGKVKTQTNTVAYSLGHSWSANDYRPIVAGNVYRASSITLTGSTTLDVSNKVSFSISNTCSFSGTGGTYDTPYCGDTSASIQTFGANSTWGRVLWGSMSQPATTYVSSNTSVMTCSGATCTAIAPGTTTIKVTIPAATTVAKIAFRTTDSLFAADMWDAVLRPIQDICNTCANKYASEGVAGLSQGSNNKTLTIPKYETSWVFTVNGPSESNDSQVSVSCSVNPLIATVGQTVTWTASASGGDGAYSYLWSGDDFVNGKTTAVVSGSYSTLTPAVKHATTTITSGGTTLSVGCPTNGTVSSGDSNGGGNGGGGGVTVTSVVDGSCGLSNNVCLAGTWVDVADTDAQYKWNCVGLGAGATDANCSLTKGPLPVSVPSCFLTMSSPAASQVNINSGTTWTGTTDCASCSKTWTIDGVQSSATGLVLNNVFTTVGVKTVSLTLATSSVSTTCSASTTIVYQGGSTQEE